ncbi:DUF1289 domain-containing protein [Vibrio sp. DW001]|uniref:DUF1289 domain-containing protein n=1 Tax=Vibrio sp. DW001 TaxID=2912315 RepID=UPI0023B173F0|nr:DUF1289 domain-containing protein [Vibrio sp. DW001]WED28354.1 DUF1289 domain-containing protein [Vibrio sp. DW001]
MQKKDRSIESEPPCSPCIRHCCLDGGDICLGCHRSLSEIMQWSESSNESKRQILNLANARGLSRIESDKLRYK